jgi:2Fe-2S ferredoxin
MDKKIPIFYVNEARIVLASHGESILEAAINAGIELSHACGAMGTCGTCRVFVGNGQGSLSPRNKVESEMAADRGFTEDERLACQTLAVAGVQFKRPLDAI